MKKILFLTLLMGATFLFSQEKQRLGFVAQATFETIGEAITVSDEASGYQFKFVIDVDNLTLEIEDESCKMKIFDVDEKNQLLVLCEPQGPDLKDLISLSLDLNTAEGLYMTIKSDISRLVAIKVIDAF